MATAPRACSTLGLASGVTVRVLSVSTALVAVATLVACVGLSPASGPAETSAIDAVQSFYAVYDGALGETSSAFLTEVAVTRERERQARCRAAAEADDLPAECEADPFLCAQDDVELTPPVFRAPGTVVVRHAGEGGFTIEVDVAVEAGATKLDAFRCVAP
jgi:hypothetical protein